MRLMLKAEIRRLTSAEYIRQFEITETCARENESRFRAIIEAIEQGGHFVWKRGGEWLGTIHSDEWYGPMPLDDAQKLAPQ